MSNGGGFHVIRGFNLKNVPQGEPEEFVRPMLATLVDKPFNSENWIFEVKWDGYRALADVRSRRARLYSRNFKSFDEKFSALLPSLRRIDHDVVLDGEIVALDERGISQFRLLQNYQRTGRGEIAYYVFDLLFLDGHDLRSLPLIERKERLRQILPLQPDILLSEHIRDRGIEFYADAQKKGLEGIIAKEVMSPYRGGYRSEEWLKVKTHLRQEFVIGGYTTPRGTRSHFGSLLLGVFYENRLHYVGHVGTGFSLKTLKDVSDRLERLKTSTCPFENLPIAHAKAHWVTPQLICEVSFQEWTDDGLLRQPSFQGLRIDKSALAVVRELATPVEKALYVPTSVYEDEISEGPAPTERRNRLRLVKGKRRLRAIPLKGALSSNRGIENETIRVGRYCVQLTHLNKVFWPEDHLTKRDLVEYYRDVAEVLLPHLKDRPLSLHRHPDGILDEGFFQKNVERTPSFVRTTLIKNVSSRKKNRYVLCQNEATLLYLANLGCIELHPWLSRLSKEEYPDFMVIDLDPEGVPFDTVIEVAQCLHRLLYKIGATSVCKTSGATGIHVAVPLGGKYAFGDVRQFAEILARLVQRKLPDITSVERRPLERPNRVYLDYLQNHRVQTIASAYSVRPRPGAPVSTPLKWSEVKAGLSPTQFTLRNVRERIAKLGDLWAPVLDEGIDLPGCLTRLERLTVR